jgi:hypothetical protein
VRPVLVLLVACGSPVPEPPLPPDPAAVQACRASLEHTAEVVSALPEHVRDAAPEQLRDARERAEASVATCAGVDEARWRQALQLRDGLAAAERSLPAR